MVKIEMHISEIERAHRDSSICAGCHKVKDIGLVVCWNCYKYRTDIKPFKYFQGDIEEWLLQI